jgi:LacI family gluconate utilization system Gnt-I transcriptional repressor
MRDVARHAGVGAITVSRVLSGASNVSEETRARVLEAARELGYVPNHLARDFASSRTPLVGVIVPTVANLMFADKIEALAEVLHPHGYQLLVAHNAYSLETELKQIEAFVAQRVSGIVLTGITHDPRTRALLERSNIPTIETWNLPEKPIDMAVGFSNVAAAEAMVELLAKRGYRHIALVHPLLEANDRAADRLKGYRAAMKRLRLPQRKELERASPFGFASGAKALGDLFENTNSLDAIFFGNDALAAGALLECRRRGISVPNDLAIAGFDDVDLAQQMDPPLTTVRVPMREIGRQAGELLLRRFNGEETGQVTLDLGFEIIERQSTKV